MTNEFYHIPVLRKEVAELLITDPGGVYIDGTLGGGGHAEYLLQKISDTGRYIGLDLDAQAIAFAQKRLQRFKNISFFQSNFRDVAQIVTDTGITSVNGLLLDLGVSSYQIDTAQRGFSYLLDGEIDMRMNQTTSRSAKDILNTSPEEELSDIFFHFGEEKRARKLARLIVDQRKKQPIKDTIQLRKLVERIAHPKYVVKSLARVFQALRIAVNEELENLSQILAASLDVIKPGGRIAVIAYHSLEDRIVKRFFRLEAEPCICPPELPQCVCGRLARIKIITKKPIRASAQEIAENSRARSALLRVGEVI
jgi:16S rRNA (cytosine1402-N4)-methyltransferase